MLNDRLADVDAALLAQVVTEKWPETPTLDFKAKLPIKDKDKEFEFAKDVVAFANMDGGDLVYGIAADKDGASKIMPITAVAADAEERRLRQYIDVIEPRIQGIDMRAVAVDGGFVFIVRVPASYNAPHGVHEGERWRFPIRAGTRTSEMTYDQLRSAFDRTATLRERADRFRNKRLDLVKRNALWQPLADEPRLVVHVIPLAGIAGRFGFDTKQLFYEDTRFKDAGRRIPNLDGLVLTPVTAPENTIEGLVQVFRNGALEFVRSVGVIDPNGRRVIYASRVARWVHHWFTIALLELRAEGASGPAIVAWALYQIRAYDFVLADPFATVGKSDRQEFEPDALWVEDVGGVEPADALTRAALNVLWQSFGLPECTYFDGAGTFTLP